jgi:hypothetical protein
LASHAYASIALLSQEGSTIETQSRSRGRFLSSSSQYSADCFNHSLAILKNIFVFKTEYLHAKLSEEFRAATIPFGGEQAGMEGTIKFDNDATFRTIKVDNIRTYAVLPAKLLSVKSAVSEASPE